MLVTVLAPVLLILVRCNHAHTFYGKNNDIVTPNNDDDLSGDPISSNTTTTISSGGIGTSSGSSGSGESFTYSGGIISETYLTSTAANSLLEGNDTKIFQTLAYVNHTAARRALHESESNLFRHLFNGKYVKEARPCRAVGDPVMVYIDMVIMKINQLVERDQEIIITGYLKIAWSDDRMAWDPSNYGGVDWIVVPSNIIWIPDVGLINAVDMYSITRDYRFPAVVDFLGNVIWVPAGKLVARCEFDVTYFPFDNQTCYYRMESWSYPINFLNITGKSMTISPAHYVMDQQWRLLSITVFNYIVGYEEGSFNFSRIDFRIALKRKPLFYVTYTIIPAIVLSALQVFSHFLPVDDSNNRISFATTGLISFSVLHVSISESMPRTSDHLPVIAIYVDVVMGLIGSFLIETFFVSYLLQKVQYSAPPTYLWTIVVDVMGRISFFPIERLNLKYIDLTRMLESRKHNYLERWRRIRTSTLEPSEQDGSSRSLPRRNNVSGVRSPSDLRGNQRASLFRLSTDWSNGRYITRATTQQTISEDNAEVTLLSPSETTTATNNNNKHQRSNHSSVRDRISFFFNNAAYDSSNYSSDENGMRRGGGSSAGHGCQACVALVKTMGTLREDVALLRELCDELGERQLRDLSLEVWIGLLAIVDRYLFMLAISIAIWAPTYLFIILPPYHN